MIKKKTPKDQDTSSSSINRLIYLIYAEYIRKLTIEHARRQAVKFSTPPVMLTSHPFVEKVHGPTRIFCYAMTKTEQPIPKIIYTPLENICVDLDTTHTSKNSPQ